MQMDLSPWASGSMTPLSQGRPPASHVVDHAEDLLHQKVINEDKTWQQGLHIVFPNPNCWSDKSPPTPPPQDQWCFKNLHVCLLLGVRKLGWSSFITGHHNCSSPFFSLLLSSVPVTVSFVYLDYYLSVHLPFFHPSLPLCLYHCFSLLLSRELRQTRSSKVHNCSCSLEGELR